jgi:hypothetical protein
MSSKKIVYLLICHNLLTKLRSNLNQELWDKQDYSYPFHLLKTYIRKLSLLSIIFKKKSHLYVNNNATHVVAQEAGFSQVAKIAKWLKQYF